MKGGNKLFPRARFSNRSKGDSKQDSEDNLLFSAPTESSLSNQLHLLDLGLVDDLEPHDFVAKFREACVDNSPLLHRNLLHLTENLRACRGLLAVSSYVSGELDHTQVLEKIMEASYFILSADRVSLFEVDSTANELVMTHSRDDLKDMRVPMGQGIAGYVATEKKLVNVYDAYSDPRFLPEVDERTHYRTKSVLCSPIEVNGEV